MINQSNLQDYIPKEKTHYLELARKDKLIFSELMQQIKTACELLKKMYWENVEYHKKMNKIYQKYQPDRVVKNPEERGRHKSGFAYAILCREVGGSDEIIFECIDCGILVKDDTYGYIYKEASK